MQISPLGGCLVSALSIPIGENGTIPLLTLALITITSMQLQTSKLPDYLTSTPPATLKHKYYIQNVLVSIPICKIINKKKWHWPPNTLFNCYLASHNFPLAQRPCLLLNFPCFGNSHQKGRDGARSAGPKMWGEGRLWPQSS
jgi:hypothetical protein